MVFYYRSSDPAAHKVIKINSTFSSYNISAESDEIRLHTVELLSNNPVTDSDCEMGHCEIKSSLTLFC